MKLALVLALFAVTPAFAVSNNGDEGQDVPRNARKIKSPKVIPIKPGVPRLPRTPNDEKKESQVMKSLEQAAKREQHISNELRHARNAKSKNRMQIALEVAQENLKRAENNYITELAKSDQKCADQLSALQKAGDTKALLAQASSCDSSIVAAESGGGAKVPVADPGKPVVESTDSGTKVVPDGSEPVNSGIGDAIR